MSYPILKIPSRRYEISLVDETTYTPGSSDIIKQYLMEYKLSESKSFTTGHGVIIGSLEEPNNSCILFANAAPTTIHDRSYQIQNDKLYFAVSDYMVCLELPSLDLVWSLKVDSVCCYGVHYSDGHGCLISHGECEISKVSFDGALDWNIAGKDIFAGGFDLYDDHIEVVDFNGEKYSIDIESGEMIVVGA